MGHNTPHWSISQTDVPNGKHGDIPLSIENQVWYDGTGTTRRIFIVAYNTISEFGRSGANLAF